MTLDIFIFSVFLASNLIVGLLCGRRKTTFKQYVLGDKRFSTETITLTLVSTAMGGRWLLDGRYTYTQGVLCIVPVLVGLLVSYWCIVRVVVMRMGEFLNTFSVAEAMGNLYGRAVRILTAISSLLGITSAMALHFRIIPAVLGRVLGLQGASVTCIIVSIVIVYSAWGGIRAVTMTALVQYIVIGIGLSLLLVALYMHCQNPTPIETVLTTYSLFGGKPLQELVGWNRSCMHWIALGCYWAFPGQVLHPAVFQRIAMAYSTQQVKNAFVCTACCFLLLIGSLLFVGIMLVAHTVSFNFPVLVKYMLATYTVYPACKGLLAIGLVALAMSTAASLLNTAAVLMVQDVIKPLQRAEGQKRRDRYDLALVRVWTVGIGLFVLLMTYLFYNLPQVLWLFHSIMIATYVPPFLLAIVGFRTTPTAVHISMAAGGITLLVGYIFSTPTYLESLLLGIVANGLALVVSHRLLLLPKGKIAGWIRIPQITLLLEVHRQRRQNPHGDRFQLRSYFRRLLPKNEGIHSLFALYALIAIYVPFFKVGNLFWEKFPTLNDIVFHSVILLIAALLTYPAWPPTFRSKTFISFLWPIGIGYIFFCADTVIVLASGLNPLHIAVWLGNLLVASWLLPWKLILLMIGIGTTVAVSFIQILADMPLIYIGPFEFTMKFLLLYNLLLPLIVLVMRYKHQGNKLLVQQEATYEQSLERAGGEYELHLLSLPTVQQEALANPQNPRLSTQQGVHILPMHTAEAKQITQSIQQQPQVLRDYRTANAYQKAHALLDLKKITITDLVGYVTHLLTLYELHERVHGNVTTQQKYIVCDSYKIAHVLLHGLRYLIQDVTSFPALLLSIQDTTLQYPLQDGAGNQYITTLSAIGFILSTEIKIFPLQASYPGYTGELAMPTSSHIEDLPQHINERIVEAHYGYSHVRTTASSQQLLYVLPVTFPFGLAERYSAAGGIRTT